MYGTRITGDVRQKKHVYKVNSELIHHTQIRRNDPTDCYKPNSDAAVDILATTPISQQLVEEDDELLRRVAADMDRSLRTDEIENYPVNPYLSEVAIQQLNRLPTWIRSMIESRWNLIFSHFGPDVVHFLKVIADIINRQYKGPAAKRKLVTAPDPHDDDMEIMEEISSNFYLQNKDIERDAPGELGFNQNSIYRVSQALTKWKKCIGRKRRFWENHMINRAEVVLRTAMITKASAADLAIIAEEEGAFAAESGEDSDDDAQKKRGSGHWENFALGHKDVMKQEAKDAIDFDFRHKANFDTTRKEKEQIKKQRQAALKKQKKTKVECWSYLKCNRLFQSKIERKKKKQAIVDRAVYRRFSRIWYKDCGEYMHHSKKVDQHSRFDEGFHQYVTALVTWWFFKSLIMCVIMANAVLLALESGNLEPDEFFLFEILDLLFLSLYLVEFGLKIYAQPYKFWRSGYNIFDFAILAISLFKTVLDWFDSEHIPFLKVLLIVRALRILRGVSLSVELQVLVTALAETIKTHVLSVVILLILLLYIAAVVAHHFFAKDTGLEQFDDLGKGMLTMFTFVTMDGWTDIIESFEKVGLFYGGRAFGLILIVLGNFLFSNIFIAIIIMNISEATDDHREKQRNQREGIVARKKDIVFRRQKLDMRQLLARQKMSICADFYHMGCQFQRLLRHDDLVAMQEVCTSPLWMDCLHKTIIRCQYTSTMLLNLYREMGDELHGCYNLYKESSYRIPTIRRALYNRYMLAKARLSLIKRQLYRHRFPEQEFPLRINLPDDGNNPVKTRNQPKKEQSSSSDSDYPIR